jgi:hypothetical protein
MESKRGPLCIFVAVVLVVMALMCCGMVALGAATAPWWASWPSRGGIDWGDGSGGRQKITGTNTEQIERTFDLGEKPSLRIDNFAGTVKVRPGEGSTIHVVATKRVRSDLDLERIVVDMAEEGDRLTIKTTAPAGLDNVSVSLEITAPAGTYLDLHTGAGSADVRGLRGGVEAVLGAGSLTISDVSGEIDAKTGAGSIEYHGAPAGDCSFDVGAGSILLGVPTNLNMSVDLMAGLGGVHSDLKVDGTVTRRRVQGTVGTGDQGTLTAHSGVGGIDLVRE